MSKGIAYKKDFFKDWRSKDKKAVCHTGLSHALSIFYFLCSENLNKDIDIWLANDRNGADLIYRLISINEFLKMGYN